MKQALANIRVLDLTRFLPGPYASLLLVDLGADVIKVERPGRGDPVRATPPFVDGQSAQFAMLNRGKKSLTLDLQRVDGRRLFLQLAQDADIVMEGFRPGVAHRLGIDYERVKAVNERIIYCSISGFGQHGPYRDHVGHDINYIARAGLLGLTGTGMKAGSGPVIPAIPVADLAGAMFAVVSLLASLRRRDRDASGAYLDVSLTDAVVSWLSLHFAQHFRSPQLEPDELVLAGGYPCYHVYRTKDEKFVAVGALERRFWAQLCEVLGVPEYIPHQYSPERREEIFRALDRLFRTKRRTEWLELLNPEEFPIAPVADLDEVADDPHFGERGLFRREQVHALPVIALPVDGVHRSGEERSVAGRRQPDSPEVPELGAHNDEILMGLGCSAAEIERLRGDGVL